MASDIYRGFNAPQDRDVIWIKDGVAKIYTNGGWESIGTDLSELEEYLSETSVNPIQNSAVYRQYMTFDDIIDIFLAMDPEFLNKSYLTFRVLSDGNIIWNAANSIQYSKNNASWETLNAGDSINVVEKDQIRFKGNISIPSSSTQTEFGFMNSTCQFEAYGNIMSLAFGDNFFGVDTISNTYQFYGLFCVTNIISAKNLALPATTLSVGCYGQLFLNCPLLKNSPKFPATSLTQYAYYYAFSGCSSLVELPELPATTLGTSCYEGMFNECSSLVSASSLSLPSDTMVDGCYANMFRYCTSLTTGPTLSATTLAKNCYERMFVGCTALINAPVLPAETMAEGCYKEMFGLCTNLVVAPELPATTLAKNCYYGMFDNCSKLKESPVLPAEVLVQGCYDGIFYKCPSLNKIVCYATDISATNCIANWVFGVASKGTFTKVSGVEYPEGKSGIPTGWTVVEV